MGTAKEVQLLHVNRHHDPHRKLANHDRSVPKSAGAEWEAFNHAVGQDEEKARRGQLLRRRNGNCGCLGAHFTISICTDGDGVGLGCTKAVYENRRSPSCFKARTWHRPGIVGSDVKTEGATLGACACDWCVRDHYVIFRCLTLTPKLSNFLELFVNHEWCCRCVPVAVKALATPLPGKMPLSLSN